MKRPPIPRELAGRVLAEVLAGVTGAMHADAASALSPRPPPPGTACAELEALLTGRNDQLPQPLSRKPGAEMREIVTDVVRGMAARGELQLPDGKARR